MSADLVSLSAWSEEALDELIETLLEQHPHEKATIRRGLVFHVRQPPLAVATVSLALS